MAEKKIDAGEIQIEDPLDFLSPSEKKAYIRAHQDTLLRSEEEMERIREATEAPPPGITTDTDQKMSITTHPKPTNMKKRNSR